MTLIDTQKLIEQVHVHKIVSRPSGKSRYRAALPSRTERALMSTIGRPWA
jgi:hypothetical protein